MANVDKAFGLRPLGNLSASGSQKQYGYEATSCSLTLHLIVQR
jgi:hypothetical protein